ncbi:MAG: TniQ family protein [Loktanella sp.]|nr:TniQ family protein [Loktanella sp.]
MTEQKFPFHSDELFVSYVSRRARALGLAGTLDFLRDLDVGRAAVLDGDGDTIKRVAVALDVNPDAALRQTFQRGSNQDVVLCDMNLKEKWVLRGKFRVCPACIRADIGPALNADTVWRAYAWLSSALVPVRVCPVHRLALVYPPEAPVPHEFHISWEAWIPEIMDGELDQPVAGQGLYEDFLARSISG